MEFIIALYIFVLGLVIGSFLNVCIYRIPMKKSLSKGFSHCPTCDHRLHTKDLVPVFSYLSLKGRCRYCKTPISKRYPLIELLTGLLFLFVFLVQGFTLDLLIFLPLTAILLVITMIDLDHMIIPDGLQIAIFILALCSFFVFDLSFIDRIIGFFIISLPFYILLVLTGGIGGGDIKLMAVTGFLFGWKITLVAAFLGIIFGGIGGIILLSKKDVTKKSEIPFGPYLCFGIYLSMLYGTQILQWYLNFF